VADVAHLVETAPPPFAAEEGRAEPRAVRSPRYPASVSAALVITALGTLLIAVGYAAGRGHYSWAAVPFWAGWVGSFLALATVVASPAASTRVRVAVLLVQAAQQSLVRWMYSPLSFTFPDELQHWRTATDILASHHLFHSNPTLPVSPVFPGLEELASAIAQVARIGLFPAGVVVAATSHIALAGAVFYLYRRVSRDDRIAGVAAFLFALNPLHAGFDTQFIYEGPALLLGAAALEIALADAPRARVETAVAISLLAALVVTHHLTAAAVIGTLGALGIVLAVLTRRGLLARALLSLFVAGVVLAAAWILAEATPVLSYLGAPLVTVITGVVHAGHVSGRVALPAASAGSPGAWLTVLATLVTAALVIMGAMRLWRGRLRSASPVARAFALCALSYFAVLAIREFAPDGAEMAGRLLTFAAFFTCITMAFVLVPAWDGGLRWRRFARPAALLAMLAIFLGAMESGWPAPWEQLPGTFHAAAFESGIDRQNTSAAQWFRANVGAGQRVACDFSSCSLLGAYAEAHPIADVANIYYAPRVDDRVKATIQKRRIAYVFVDRRLSSAPPITGHFFHVTHAHAGEKDLPVPRGALTKFQTTPGVQLIYNSGTIQIYDVRALRHGQS
jgi:hypothetical protein